MILAIGISLSVVILLAKTGWLHRAVGHQGLTDVWGANSYSTSKGSMNCNSHPTGSAQAIESVCADAD